MGSDNNNKSNNLDSMSPSCRKCVQVLRDLVSGLQQEGVAAAETETTKNTSRGGGGGINNNMTMTAMATSASEKSANNDKMESPPLTLIKAIAGGQPMKIEPIRDGVKMHLPVETTMPQLLKRFSTWMKEEEDAAAAAAKQQQQEQQQELIAKKLQTTTTTASQQERPLPLATSMDHSQEDKVASSSSSLTPSATTVSSENPLTIELKCRKCSSTGPEGGARAFLMGPKPLSIVVCHNRILSSKSEVEEILTHELVHLYDVQTLQLDLQQCENLAYSEVRAAKAAECRDSWKQLQSYCVKQKAICATNNLFPSQGRACIQKVFQKAFNDNRPFSK